MGNKALIIINPVAGMKKVNKHLLEIVMMLSDAGYECQVQTTHPTNSATSIAEKYATENTLIVCAGGDGTLNEVVAGCLKNNIHPEIGYIPAGSTNDFANGLKLPMNPLKAMKNILIGEPQKIDIGMFNDRPFMYTASFGIFTKASYNTPRELKNSLGYMAYLLEGTKELADIKSYYLKIEAENKIIEGDFIFGGVCNSKQIGGGVVKFDDEMVDLNDGLLEIFMVRYPKTLPEFMQLILDLNTNNYNSPMIEFLSVNSAKITTNDEIDWTIDGEYQRGTKEIEIKNIHSGLTLIF